jgi:outer membrane biosynthesis protein TonB
LDPSYLSYLRHNLIVRQFAVVLLLAAAVSGCTRTHASTPSAPVALLTPPPPERVIIPATIPEPAPPPAPAVPAPPAVRPQPAPPRTERPAAPASAPQAAQPPAAAEPTPAPPVLQVTTNPEEVEQRARASMAAAQRDLDRINPAQLTANARAQYDTARAFIRQADTALKVKNVVLARELADKAAALASQLRR